MWILPDYLIQILPGPVRIGQSSVSIKITWAELVHLDY